MQLAQVAELDIDPGSRSAPLTTAQYRLSSAEHGPSPGLSFTPTTLFQTMPVTMHFVYAKSSYNLVFGLSLLGFLPRVHILE